MQHIANITQTFNFQREENNYKKRRDELFYRLLNGWNRERKKAGFDPISNERLATAINKNPILKRDDGELELLIKTNEERGNYKHAHFILFK